jgi:hypothetical protein
MNANFFLVTAVLSLATTFPVFGGNEPEDAAAKERWAIVRTLRVGDAEDLVRAKMRNCMERDMQALIRENERIRQPLEGQRTAGWLVYTNRGVQFLVIAVLSRDRKLADLLSFNTPSRLVPLVRGMYSERLESIKVGMNIDDVYRLLGPKSPDYYRRRGKDWSIGFLYQDAGRDGFCFCAEAASGTIIYASREHL